MIFIGKFIVKSHVVDNDGNRQSGKPVDLSSPGSIHFLFFLCSVSFKAHIFLQRVAYVFWGGKVLRKSLNFKFSLSCVKEREKRVAFITLYPKRQQAMLILHRRNFGRWKLQR